MKKRSILRLFLPLLALLLLFGSLTTAVAEEKYAVDFDKKGSISVVLRSGKTPLSDVEMTLYQIAVACDKNGALGFEYIDKLSSFRTDIGSLQTAGDRNELLSFAKKQGVLPVAMTFTDENGAAKFSDLPLGIYLCVQTTSVPGYADSIPFIAVIPSKVNGKLTYDVDASPKTEVAEYVDVTVKKVWNDSEKTHKEIKVRLIKSGRVVETVTLNEENGWTHTWTNRPKSDSYRVKEVSVPKGYYVTYKSNGSYSFTITNSSVLIQTGQHKLPVPILAVAGILLFIMGWRRSYVEKNKKEEQA